jgi:hypothetical protein
VVSQTGADGAPTPALLHRMWHAPYDANTRSASASTASRFETSVTTLCTSAPRARSSLAVLSSARASTSAITTFIPSPTNAPASARPMPLAPPVTTATCPLNSRIDTSS